MAENIFVGVMVVIALAAGVWGLHLENGGRAEGKNDSAKKSAGKDNK